MTAILSHRSLYPPKDWSCILRPVTASTHPIWVEMTKSYDLTMAAQRVRTCQNTMTNTVPEETIDSMLKSWAKRDVQKQITRDMHLEMEDLAGTTSICALDGTYEIRTSKEDFAKILDHLTESALETIDEEVEFQPEQKLTKPEPTTVQISAEYAEQLSQLQHFLANHEVQTQYRPRLEEIILQFTDISTKHAITNEPRLAFDLYTLYGEVQDHHIEWQIQGEGRKITKEFEKISTSKGIGKKLRNIFRRSSFP